MLVGKQCRWEHSSAESVNTFANLNVHACSFSSLQQQLQDKRAAVAGARAVIAVTEAQMVSCSQPLLCYLLCCLTFTSAAAIWQTCTAMDSAHSSCCSLGLLNVQAGLRQEVQQCTDLKAELLHKWDQINKFQANNEVRFFRHVCVPMQACCK